MTEWRLISAEGGRTKHFVIADGKNKPVQIRTKKPMTLDELLKMIKAAKQ